VIGLANLVTFHIMRQTRLKWILTHFIVRRRIRHHVIVVTEVGAIITHTNAKQWRRMDRNYFIITWINWRINNPPPQRWQQWQKRSK
jgi:hypothetical protein